MNKMQKTKINKTVFLTGATGHMGWAGFQELHKRKNRFNITLLARPSKKNRKLLAPYAGDPSVRIVWGDLMNYSDVLEGVTGADYVLHVGGMVSPQADYHPRKTLEVNVRAAENVVKAILAQPDRDNIKAVYIGSVAQCGDRLSPVHWGRTGDPVYASDYDSYSVSKCLAEKIFADSGLKNWVSLRQSGMLYTDIFKNIGPIVFHVPVKGVLEWTTVEDSGRLLANVCEDGVPDEFWNRFYNIGSGEQYRLTNYDFEKRIIGALGLDMEKVFEPQWFATRNFHGMWYLDSDILENYLHFRANVPVDEYFKRLVSRLPWFYSLARFVPAPLIRKFMKPLTEVKDLGTQYWIKNDPDKVKSFYGSMEEYLQIRSWEQSRPGRMEKNMDAALKTGEAVLLNHGYDTSRSIYSLSADEIEEAARFRGGHFVGPADRLGQKGALFEWECEHGHRFTASLEYVLLGGGWCDVCDPANVRSHVSPANRFIWQVLTGQSLE